MPFHSATRFVLAIVTTTLLLLLAADWVAVAAPNASAPQNTIPSPDTLRGCGGAQFPSSDEAFEQEILRLINQIRLGNGLLPLKQVDTLTSAARFHATDMSEESYFSHTSHDRINGELVESCAWNDRIQTYYTDWNSISENIAAGYATPQSVVDAWMNSPGHRQNILSPYNWEVGIGYFMGSGSYTRYWVQDFGRRRDVYPVVINGDAAITDDGALTIHTYGTWDNLRVRIDQDEWSPWQPFAVPLAWQLKARVGTHTVEVEMRNATESATASDSIYLSQHTAEPELNQLPDTLTFFYNSTLGSVSPSVHSIQPLAFGGDPSYLWQVAKDASWLHISPEQGNSTEIVSIEPSLSSADQPSSDQAMMRVSLRKGDGVVVAEKEIIVSLIVVDTWYTVFVPVVIGH
jgi:uncharacterized protein YkwD